MLGIFVLVSAVAKFFVPGFRGAYLEQLSEAGFVLGGIAGRGIPTVEFVAGAMLLASFMVRPASLAVALIMGLMTFLHITVHEPTFYPLQFGLPLIPMLAAGLAVFLYLAQSEGVPA